MKQNCIIGPEEIKIGETDQQRNKTAEQNHQGIKIAKSDHQRIKNYRIESPGN